MSTARAEDYRGLHLKNADVHDGTRLIGKRDVFVHGAIVGRIEVAGSQTPPGYLAIEAGHLLACPGFIDVHNMTRTPEEIEKRDGINLLAQGVTTIVAGNCGQTGEYIDRSEIDQRLTQFARMTLPVNFATLIGHGSARGLVNSDSILTSTQRDDLRGLIAQGIDAGAVGMSLGLMYAPGRFADLDELKALATQVGDLDAVLTAHIRGEGAGVYTNVKQVARLSKYCRVVVSHLKVCGPKNWRTFPRIVNLLRQMNEETGQLYVSYYPYGTTNTTLASIITGTLSRPSFSPGAYSDSDELEIERSGLQTLSPYGWRGVRLTKNVAPEWIGLSVSEISEELEARPFIALLRILQDFPNARAIFCDVAEEDKLSEIADLSFSMPASDGYVYSSSSSDDVEHPRSYAAITKSLRWARDSGSLESCIRKLTSLPAEVFKLNRGHLREGAIADLVLLDPAKLIDRADYPTPALLSEGVSVVVMGGQILFKNQRLEARGCGTFLGKNRYAH